MQYSDFQGLKISRLGFGLMRLPLRADKTVDEEQCAQLFDYAVSHGVNYFDTAYPYLNGLSELVAGRLLKKYPRESYYLADKFPGHQISETHYPEPLFEEQLQKCHVDYFDFYLMHNVYENSIDVYEDARWGIVDYFVRQKQAGRIRHLGFSSHGRLDNMKRFLDRFGDAMEFCQIQLNYLDWTLQDAEAKCALLAERGIPVWVMEPVRGGKLANLPEGAAACLHTARPQESAAAWAFRWLQRLPQVKVVLSGMSNMAQLEDNVRTFSEGAPLTDAENALLLKIAEGLKDALPCTGCRYCCDGCPRQLDIPRLLSYCNDVRFEPSMTASMQLDSLPPDKQPDACIRCGACVKVCPQKIDIPKALKELADIRPKLPSWAAICRQREAAAQALRQQGKFQ